MLTDSTINRILGLSFASAILRARAANWAMIVEQKVADGTIRNIEWFRQYRIACMMRARDLKTQHDNWLSDTL